MPFWPDLEVLGKGKVPSQQVLGVLAMLPVMLTADGCHQGVLPLAAIMRPFSKRSLDSVMAVALVGDIIKARLVFIPTESLA
jgi:amino acid permease